MAVGARIMSARTEASSPCWGKHTSITHFVPAFQIWDDTKKRLCVTGIHVKMEPSPPKGKTKL